MTALSRIASEMFVGGLIIGGLVVVVGVVAGIGAIVGGLMALMVNSIFGVQVSIPLAATIGAVVLVLVNL